MSDPIVTLSEVQKVYRTDRMETVALNAVSLSHALHSVVFRLVDESRSRIGRYAVRRRPPSQCY
jgi:hypothetical protein